MGVCFSWIVAAALALRFKKRIEDTAVVAISAITLSILLPGLVISLETGFYLALALGLLCTAFCAIQFFKARDDYKKYVFTPGGWAFIFFIAFFAVFSIGRGFAKSDEFTYWGYILKGYYNYADLRIGNPIHPGTSILWNYFAEKTWIGYSEGMAFWAVDVLLVSMLLPVFRFVNEERKLFDTVLLSVIVFLFPLSLWSFSWASIMPDAIIGVSVGFVFVAAYEFIKTKDYVYAMQLFAGLYLLTTSKRIGILWASLAIFSIVVVSRLDRSCLRVVAGLVCMDVLAYAVWLGVSKYLLLPPLAAVAGVALVWGYKEHYRIITGKWFIALAALVFVAAGYIAAQKLIYNNELNLSSTLNYCRGVFTANNIAFGQVIKLSMLSLTVLFGALLLYLRQKNEANHLIYCMGISVIFSSLVFNLCLWAQYSTAIVKANEGFGQYVPGFERYVLGSFFAPLMLMGYWFLDKYGKKFRYSIIALFIGMLLMTDVSYASDYLIDKQAPVKFYGFEDAGITLNEDDKIYVIYEVPIDSNLDYSAAFGYGFFPAESISENEFYLINGDANKCITPKEFENILKDGQYDYVYIQTIDEHFAEIYGNMIEFDGVINSGTVFTVMEKDDGSVYLRKN